MKYELCVVFFISWRWKKRTQEDKRWTNCMSGASRWFGYIRGHQDHADCYTDLLELPGGARHAGSVCRRWVARHLTERPGPSTRRWPELERGAGRSDSPHHHRQAPGTAQDGFLPLESCRRWPVDRTRVRHQAASSQRRQVPRTLGLHPAEADPARL